MYGSNQVFITKYLIPQLVILLSAVITSAVANCRCCNSILNVSGKNVTAADSLKQLVCSDTKAVGT